jgi:DNA-binding beta-propeller fold protein YncE
MHFAISCELVLTLFLHLFATASSTIRRVSLFPPGLVTTVAGSSGAAGHADGSGPAARFRGPTAVSISHDGTFALVADAGNTVVRRIALSVPMTNDVTTLAGSPSTPGFADGTGAAARFLYPSGLAISPDGRFAVITDRYAATVRVIRTATGDVTTLAGLAGAAGAADGTGAAARFYLPAGVAVSPDGSAALVADEVIQPRAY